MAGSPARNATSTAMSDTPAAMPLVSVIVRSMARASLDTALAAIGAQTWPAVEAVVVAASGRSHPPVPATAGSHPARLVASDTPLSRPEAANVGLDAARGDWITFLDDDDVIDPSHIEGLVGAARRGKSRVVCSQARVRLADGSEQPWGQPFALTQIYARNFLHLSTVLFARSLIGDGCRFDPSFVIMQDWDFFLQMAQHSRFQSTGLRTFEWRADRGTSGAGGGDNHDDARFAQFRDRIHAKWRPQREALIARLAPALDAAAKALEAADWPRAERACDDALAIAQNEPHALNMLAMVMLRTGRTDDAIAMQSLAAGVCPHEPSFVFNLALLVRGRGEIDRARRLAQHALRIAPGYAPAAKLVAELGAA